MQFSRGYRIYVLVLIATTVLLNAMDQTVLPAVASLIHSEFHLSDTQVGLLFGAFVVALAVFSLPMGYLADRRSRRVVIAVGVAAWSIATLVTGLMQSFVQLLAARAAVGVGEASAQPAGTSMLADYFPERARGRAMGVVIAAAGLGTGLGLILGGIVGHLFGWRAAFFFAGLPGLLVAALFLTVREPLRGAAERSGPAVRASRDAGAGGYRKLLRIPTYSLLLVSSTLGLFAQGTGQLVQLYVHRRFGLNVQQAAALTGSPLLLGGVVGTPLYGWLIDVRSRHSARGPLEVAIVATLICSGAAVVMFSATTVLVFTVGAVIFGIVQWAFVLAPFVVIQNIVMPSLRASGVSLAVLIGRLFGSALGPVLVGVVSDVFHTKLGGSLLLLTPLSMLGSAAFLALGTRTISRDVNRMRVAWELHTSTRDGAGGSGLDEAYAPTGA
ncbi:MAG: MFS transporter [Candidatus Dormibacteria bacterium]